MPDRENEIISIVTFIHKRTGFRDPPFSLMDFLERFPQFELMPGDLPRGFNGELLKKGNQNLIRYRTGSPASVNRFVIGHEIGHAFLHEDEEFQCLASQSFSIFCPPAKNPREWEADFFSSELLTPLPVVNRLAPDIEGMDQSEFRARTARMAEVFGVGPSVMRSRLNDLCRMREWECEYL